MGNRSSQNSNQKSNNTGNSTPLKSRQHSELAPQTSGTDGVDHECPICFLNFISVNMTNCCKEKICTGCFINIQQSPSKNSSLICPFCNTEHLRVTFDRHVQKLSTPENIKSVSPEKEKAPVYVPQASVNDRLEIEKQIRLTQLSKTTLPQPPPQSSQRQQRNPSRRTQSRLNQEPTPSHHFEELSLLQLLSGDLSRVQSLNDLDDLLMMEAMRMSLSSTNTQSTPTSDPPPPFPSPPISPLPLSPPLPPSLSESRPSNILIPNLSHSHETSVPQLSSTPSTQSHGFSTPSRNSIDQSEDEDDPQLSLAIALSLSSNQPKRDSPSLLDRIEKALNTPPPGSPSTNNLSSGNSP